MRRLVSWGWALDGWCGRRGFCEPWALTGVVASASSSTAIDSPSLELTAIVFLGLRAEGLGVARADEGSAASSASGVQTRPGEAGAHVARCGRARAAVRVPLEARHALPRVLERAASVRRRAGRPTRAPAPPLRT